MVDALDDVGCQDLVWVRPQLLGEEVCDQRGDWSNWGSTGGGLLASKKRSATIALRQWRHVVAVLMAMVPETTVPAGKLKAAGKALEELEVAWSAARVARTARTAVTTEAKNSGEGRDSETGEEAEETAGGAEMKALSRLLHVWRGIGEAARNQTKAMRSGRRRKKANR